MKSNGVQFLSFGSRQHTHLGGRLMTISLALMLAAMSYFRTWTILPVCIAILRHFSTVYKLVRFYQPFPMNENPYISTRATLTTFSKHLHFHLDPCVPCLFSPSYLCLLITIRNVCGRTSMFRGLRPWTQRIQDRWSVIRPREDLSRFIW